MKRRTVSSMCSRMSADSLASAIRRRLTISFSRSRSSTRRGSVSVRPGRCSIAVRMLRSSWSPGSSGPRRSASGSSASVEDLRVGARGDGQARARVPQVEGAVRELERELLRLEHPAVLVGQDGQEDPVAQLGLGRRPVDVEELGPRRGGAVLEHVEPPGVGVARDAHVVRHHVQDEPEPARGQRGGHPVEGGGAAELRVERVVVGDVVAVGAAGTTAEARGEIRVADAEGVEVGDERRHLVEPERAPELQTVGRAALAAQRRRRLLEERVGVGHAA